MIIKLLKMKNLLTIGLIMALAITTSDQEYQYAVKGNASDT